MSATIFIHYFSSPIIHDNSYMQQDHNRSSQYDSEEVQFYSKVINDQQVCQLFIRELQMLPKGIFQVNVAYGKIYIYLNLAKYHETLEQKQKQQILRLNSKKSTDIESQYILIVQKSFPLKHSVKLHLLDGGFQPKISDCRDFFEQAMGKPYHYSIHFIDILEPLVELDKKLHHKNQMFLQMQRMGHFFLGQKYHYNELTEYYSSLTLLKDHSQKKSNIYVGITETHLLIFKQIVQKNHNNHSPLRQHHSVIVKNQKQISADQGTFNKLMLMNCAQLQCIDTILYRQNQKAVRLILKKFKSIKLYHQFEQIKKHYKFSQPQIFLRGVLKCITKFQSCQISFEPYCSSPQKEKRRNSESIDPKENERVNDRIQQCNAMELDIAHELNETERKRKVDQINRQYQKLIEYYSARANPYYLIYVNKLNNLYAKYYLNISKQTHSSEQQINSS